MAFAKHAGATIKPFVPAPCGPDLPVPDTPSEAPGILMDANRNRIMEHAQQVCSACTSCEAVDAPAVSQLQRSNAIDTANMQKNSDMSTGEQPEELCLAG